MANQDDKKKRLSKPINASSSDNGLFDAFVHDYVAPKAQDYAHDMLADFAGMLGDMAQNFLDNLFYDGATTRSSSNRRSGGNTSYETMYRKGSSTSGGVEVYSSKSTTHNSKDVKKIWLNNQDDAIELVNLIRDSINRYGNFKVGDLYDNIRPKPETTYTDWYWGWTDASQIGYKKEYMGEHRGQWYLDLPAPVQLNGKD